MSQKMKKSKKSNKKRNIIITFIIIIIIIASTLLFINKLFSKINTTDMTNNEEELMIKPDAPNDKDVVNIALFGIDTRDSDYDGSRTDAIMIISLDDKHNKIKLSSIMRDTYVDIPGKKMDKINHAYAFGGPALSIKTINQNFDMNIKEYVTVNFVALEKIIDAIGGIEIELKPEELSEISGSPRSGIQNLTGKQAVEYSRIRHVGNADYERTERQRRVMQEILDKIQSERSLPKLIAVMNIVLPYIETSFSQNQLVSLGTQMISAGKRPVEETRLPVSNHSNGKMIGGVYYLVPDTLKDNVEYLHKFIYEEGK